MINTCIINIIYKPRNLKNIKQKTLIIIRDLFHKLNRYNYLEVIVVFRKIERNFKTHVVVL